MKWKTFASVAAAALAVCGGAALAQATWDSANIPQPHLMAARAIAAQSNSWRHPGLVTCFWDDGQASQNVNKHPAGYKVFDNLYYVGNGKYGPWAIDTSDGIILIDSMNDSKEVDQYILPNMKNVGLDPARIKILIMSHGHADHFGGGQYIVDRFHPKVYYSGPDWELAQAWAKGPNPRNQGLPPKPDVLVKDGDAITLGDETIKVYWSPGHTPASLSMLIPVKDKGRPKLLAYFGGVTSHAGPAAQWFTPKVHADFDRSYARLIQLVTEAKVDGWISAHPNYDDAVFKIEKMRSNPALPNPFLAGVKETVLFLQEVKECNLNNAELETKLRRDNPGFVPSP